MADFLQEMASKSRDRVVELRLAHDIAALERRAHEESSPTPLAASGFGVIAEVKRSSPAVGKLDGPGFSPRDVAASYQVGGASAISVLTEPSRFDGSMNDLAQVASEVDVPVMRKDFLVDPIQVVEARCAGAGGVLLIAAILDPGALRSMCDVAHSLGMFVLVEVFDERDVERASVVFDSEILIGVNSRDLRSLQVNFSRFEDLADGLPSHLRKVAESGVETPSDAAELAGMGYELALVGSSLMKSDHPERLVAEMITAGRRAGERVR